MAEDRKRRAKLNLPDSEGPLRGRVFPLCVVKNSEIPHLRKYKGRIVFQGNNIRDEFGMLGWSRAIWGRSRSDLPTWFATSHSRIRSRLLTLANIYFLSRQSAAPMNITRFLKVLGCRGRLLRLSKDSGVVAGVVTHYITRCICCKLRRKPAQPLDGG